MIYHINQRKGQRCVRSKIASETGGGDCFQVKYPLIASFSSIISVVKEWVAEFSDWLIWFTPDTQIVAVWYTTFTYWWPKQPTSQAICINQHLNIGNSWA